MIREDYILAWIKRYIRMLAEIVGLVRTADYERAIRGIDLALRDLLNLGADSVQSLSEGEIMARLTMGESPLIVRDRSIFLAALLRQWGIVAAAQGKTELSRDCHVKALHVMLGVRLRPDPEPLPEYAPSIADLLDALKAEDLPSRTYAALMLFHESEGDFAKAEDALFEMLRAEPGNDAVRNMGEAFYHRLTALSDEALAAGGLPRDELRAGLAELSRVPRSGPTQPQSPSQG
jgi:hypothetical protein